MIGCLAGSSSHRLLFLLRLHIPLQPAAGVIMMCLRPITTLENFTRHMTDCPPSRLSPTQYLQRDMLLGACIGYGSVGSLRGLKVHPTA